MSFVSFNFRNVDRRYIHSNNWKKIKLKPAHSFLYNISFQMEYFRCKCFAGKN